MNVVKRIQNILKSKVINDDESTKSEELKFSSEEIHKVKYLAFMILVRTRYMSKVKSNRSLTFMFCQMQVCGILDTNAYEIAWKGRTCKNSKESSESVQAIHGRGIFPLICAFLLL